MTPEIQAQLAQLRDIRLPDQVSWWPLAHGWWLALAAICLVVLAAFAYAAWRKHTARYRALRELEAISAHNPQTFATELSMLMRRVARRKDASVAALNGSAWAAYLTQTDFEPSLASDLVEATYAPRLEGGLQDRAMRDAVATWIRRQA